MTYISCLKEHHDHIDVPVYRFDCKKYYLTPDDERSSFTPEKCAERLRRAGLESVEVANDTWTVAEIMTCFKVGPSVAVSLLLTRGFKFDPLHETWSKTGAHVGKIRRFVITSALDQDTVHPCWYALKRIAKENQAQLVVIPTPYKPYGTSNKTSWYATEVTPYLWNDPIVINKDVQVLSNVKVTATALNPLRGLENLCQGRSTVIGHPQLALKSVATPPKQRPLFLWSTGSCTTGKQYSHTPTGIKGAFHHQHGGLLVEVDADDNFFIRPLCASSNTGAITDLTITYPPSPSAALTRAEYDLRLGDYHNGQTCVDNLEAIINFITLVGDPRNLFLEDLIDGESVSHHRENKAFHKLNRVFETLDDEVESSAEVVKFWQTLAEQVVIIHSNHHDFIDRWLDRVDWRELNKKDQLTYLTLAAARVQGLFTDAFAFLMQQKGCTARFLGRDESFAPDGIEQGQHGHNPVDGARNNPNSLNKTGMKINRNHTHSASITRNVWTGGTSSKFDLEYVSGLSSWSHTHHLTYRTGKRQMFTTHYGKYCADSTHLKNLLEKANG